MLLRRPRRRPFPRRRTPAAPTDFAGLVTSLRDAGFADKEAIVEQLVASGHASARVVLRAFLEDRLVVRAPDQGVFIATSADETLPAARPPRSRHAEAGRLDAARRADARSAPTTACDAC